MEYPHSHHHRRGGRGDNDSGNDDEKESWERRRLEEQRVHHHHQHPQHHQPTTYFHPTDQNRYHKSTYDYPPPAPQVRSEEYYGQEIYGHGQPPPPPQVSHETYGGSSGGFLSGRKTVRVFPKAAGDHSLTIRDGNVVLAPSDPRDDYQHWIKDEKFATKVKDKEGFPSFALVNKATGEAIKHSAAHHPVQLSPYNPEDFDQSVLWAQADDLGEGFRAIRMINNMHLNFDAFKDNEGFHDGTIVGLWEWTKGDNQKWKIVPYSEFLQFPVMQLI